MTPYVLSIVNDFNFNVNVSLQLYAALLVCQWQDIMIMMFTVMEAAAVVMVASSTTVEFRGKGLIIT